MVYSFLKGAPQRSETPSRIDRIGLGGLRQFGRRGRLSGEVSTGNGRLRTQAGGYCQINDRLKLYSKSGFESPDTGGNFAGLSGTLTGGVRVRVAERASLFSEERIRLADGLHGAIHVFGFDFGPTSGWSWKTNLEMGNSGDPDDGPRQHRSGSFSVGYVGKEIRYGGCLEWHLESGEGLARGLAWKARHELSFQMENGWSLHGRMSASITPADKDFPSEALGVGAALAHRRSGRERFGMRLEYRLPRSGEEWPSGLEGSLYTSISPTQRVGLGYHIPIVSNSPAAPFSDDRGLFLEFAGAF